MKKNLFLIIVGIIVLSVLTTVITTLVRQGLEYNKVLKTNNQSAALGAGSQFTGGRPILNVIGTRENPYSFSTSTSHTQFETPLKPTTTAIVYLSGADTVDIEINYAPYQPVSTLNWYYETSNSKGCTSEDIWTNIATTSDESLFVTTVFNSTQYAPDAAATTTFSYSNADTATTTNTIIRIVMFYSIKSYIDLVKLYIVYFPLSITICQFNS